MLSSKELGAKGRAPYAAFRDTVRQAEAELQGQLLALWLVQGRENCVAICTFLERRFPDEYGRRERRELAGVPGRDRGSRLNGPLAPDQGQHIIVQ